MPEAVQTAPSSAAAASSSLLATPPMTLGGSTSGASDIMMRRGREGARAGKSKKGKRVLSSGEPFALLVLEGSVTAVFDSGGKGKARREQVLGPGECRGGAG